MCITHIKHSVNYCLAWELCGVCPLVVQCVSRAQKTMKSRKGRSYQKTGKNQITFQDVRACFTSKESQLLHDWKKELFQKVMKEIHQALLSLGPVIAASVFSLSTDEIDDLCPNNNKGCERRCSETHLPVQEVTDVILSASIKEEEYSDFTDHEDSTEIQNINHPKESLVTSQNTAPGGIMALMSVSIKEEEETFPVAPQDHAEAQNTPCATGLPPFPCKLEASRRAHMDADVDEGDTSSSSGIPVVTDSLSRFTDEATEPYPMDQEASEGRKRSHCPSGFPVVTANDEVITLQPMKQEDSGERERRHCPSGDGSMNTATDFGEVIKRAKAKVKSTLAASLEENHNTLPQTSPEGPDRICALSLDSYQESPAEEDVQCESNLENPKHFSVHKVHNSVNTTPTYDSESHQLFLSSLVNAEQNETLYTCTECEECFFVETDLVEHMKKHTRVRPFPCIVCEKSFFTKTHLRGHYKIHTGEKPYICTFCQKGFRRKDHLNGHVRIHTGERPYKCTECERSFHCNANLNSHRRIHR